MGNRKYHEELVQKFVDSLNVHHLEPKSPDEIPPDLRGPSSEQMPEWFTWKVQASTSNPWVEELERRLPRRYPVPFHQLISEFRFCDLEVGPIMLFANTGGTVFYELANRVFADNHMSRFLLQRGYMQFGQPHAANYDPVCFAPRSLKDKAESRIVQLDHEEILIRNRIKVVAEIAPSIEDFMERTISGEFDVS